MRWAAKRDATEEPIVTALRLHGWLVVKVSAENLPDLWCFKREASGLRVHILEVKSKGGRVRPGQLAMMLRLKAHGVPVDVVRTPAEALQAVGAVRRPQG